MSAKWVQRRLHDDEFRLEARRRRAAQLDAVSGQLGAIGPQAVAVLLAAMSDRKVVTRLRAAIAALDTITKLGRQTDIEQRLADVEAKSFKAARTRTVRRLP